MAYGKCAVAILPGKITCAAGLGLDPFRRRFLNVFDHLAHRDRPPELKEQVDMVFYRINQICVAADIF
jgi:hypothetical protein